MNLGSMGKGKVERGGQGELELRKGHDDTLHPDKSLRESYSNDVIEAGHADHDVRTQTMTFAGQGLPSVSTQAAGLLSWPRDTLRMKYCKTGM